MGTFEKVRRRRTIVVGRIIVVVGFLASLLAIFGWITGKQSFKDLIPLGIRGTVPEETDRLVALVESCRYDEGKCDLGTVRALLRAGASPSAKTNAGVPILHLAMYSYLDLPVVATLIDAGADVRGTSSQGETALMGLAGCRNDRVLQDTTMLIRAGADVNAQNSDGWTALMFAAYHGQTIEFIKILLDAGARVLLKSNDGRTAIDVASKHLEELERGGHADLAQNAKKILISLRSAAEGEASPSGQPFVTSTEMPPMPYIERDVCPGEGCSMGKRMAEKPTEVYSWEGDTSNVSFTLRPHEIYNALKGNVHVTRFGIVEVTAPIYKPGEGGPGKSPIFRPGDTVYILTQYGEGFVDVWFKGTIYYMTEFWPRRGVMKLSPYQEWWVYVEGPEGRSGWLRP